ncbi:MAG: NAD(P)H:quinone oxidoreductase [Nocardioidaceae bacterium]|nr:NAD(P)H:quinone oxidoreductase [Nocardioidaceae bacterium]
MSPSSSTHPRALTPPSRAVAEGAESAGAEVRLRRVTETAPQEAIDGSPGWKAWLEGPAQEIEIATHDDLQWADGVAMGTPTRYGNVSAQLKQFMDTTGPLWAQGLLAGKAYTGFTSAMNTHGGNESTLLALYNTLHHWGGVIVAPGYTDPALYAAGGNPYGTSHATGPNNEPPSDLVLTAARHQGSRLADIAGKLAG